MVNVHLVDCTWFSMDIQSNWQGGLLDVERAIQYNF